MRMMMMNKMKTIKVVPAKNQLTNSVVFVCMRDSIPTMKTKQKAVTVLRTFI